MRTVRILGTGVMLLVSLLVSNSSADPVKSGYDLFETDPARTFADLSGPAALANIPFSGPPEKVRISLSGVPVKSFRDREGREIIGLGTTDTVIERTGEVPHGGSATVQLRAVALSLKGAFTDDTGRKWEVRVMLSEKQLSTGTMTIRHETEDGGTFNATLTVVPRFVFTSGADQRVLDPGPAITFESVPVDSSMDGLQQKGVPWSHKRPKNGVILGNFFPAIFNELAQLAAHGISWAKKLLEKIGFINVRKPTEPPKGPKDVKGKSRTKTLATHEGLLQEPEGGFLIVAFNGANTMAILDLTTRQITAEIPVGTFPIALDLSPDGRRAYVANFGSGDVYVVDIPTRRTIDVVKVGNQPTALTLDPNANMLYTSNFQDGTVTAVKVLGDTHQVVATIRGFRQPIWLTLSPNGRRGYVSSQRSGEGVTVFDTATMSITARVPMPGMELRHLAVSSDDKKLYAVVRTDASGTGQIVVIETESLKIVQQIPVKEFPLGLTVSPSGRCLIVTHAIPNLVSFVDLPSGQVLGVFEDAAAQEPQEAAIVEGLVYVTNRVSDTISIFDLGPCE